MSLSTTKRELIYSCGSMSSRVRDVYWESLVGLPKLLFPNLLFLRPTKRALLEPSHSKTDLKSKFSDKFPHSDTIDVLSSHSVWFSQTVLVRVPLETQVHSLNLSQMDRAQSPAYQEIHLPQTQMLQFPNLPHYSRQILILSSQTLLSISHPP
ncbi:hypothetical protein MANES_09G096850v8 [Manihot esculenta]|uniref:Uncharacterized protein n=1 Tax=Manihot esculenta TaxID=3983 RepID=A0ACB7H5C6_MANES|nr:hypothetical protein MANES_09G096850v8 [Manihot esculenta]